MFRAVCACKACGENFERVGTSRRLYCSDRCKFRRSGRVEKQCPVCGKLFFTKAERKFCSRGCYGKNEGERRHGTAHPTFRPVPNYGTIHKWASSQWTKSGSCEYCCKVVGRTEWANIDGYYGREQDGWAELCAPCHRYLDSPSGTVAKTQFWLAREGNAPWG